MFEEVIRSKARLHATSLDVSTLKYVVKNKSTSTMMMSEDKEILSSFTKRQDHHPVRELFGGAMRLRVPERFRDVSDFRPVPDSQEVFTCLDTEETLIVEILEYQDDVSDEKAAKFFFEELAEQNDASSFSILSSESLPESSRPLLPKSMSVLLLKGTQDASKFREASKNKIAVYQTVVRLRNVRADLLITLTVPIRIDLSSSSAKVVSKSVLKHGIDLKDSESLFRGMVKSFGVFDWSLFV